MTALLHIIGGILAVLLLFFLAIMIHEFGHFIAARRLGFKVDAFSICFGPALWKKVVDGVEYRIGCIPLGGYVALPQLDPSSMNVIQGGAGKGAGKNGKPANAEDPKAGGAVARQDAPPPMPAWRRIVVAVAGPAGNIALAAALAIAIAALAPQSDFGGQGTTVGAVTGKRAEECGIHTGDEIVAIGDQPVAFWSDIVVECHLAGDTDSGIAATVRRDGSELTLTLPLERDESSGFVGLDGISPLRETEIASIAGDSPASRSRLAKGDRVLSINGTAPASPSEAVALVRAAGTNAVAVCVARSGSDAPVMVEITPEFDAVLGRHVLGVVFADPASSIPQWMTYRSPWKQLSSDAKSIFRMLRALVAPKTPGEQKRAASGMGGPGG